MIRIDEIWLSVDPMDMRANSNLALARFGNVVGYVSAR